MNRRELIKRSIAGGIVALVGLPKAKAKDFDMAAAQELMFGEEWTATIEWPKPEPPVGWEITLPVIRHEGDWAIWQDPIYVGVVDGCKAWKPGKMFLEIQDALIPHWVSFLVGETPFRIKILLASPDAPNSELIGYYAGGKVTGWQGEQRETLQCRGNFAFELLNETH